MRLIIMGTPDFGVPSFAALAEAGHDIICAYSQPPRPAGRGQKLRKSPVHEFAQARGIEVRTPVSLKDPDVQAEFAALEADAAIVIAYGLILPEPVLAAPRLGCLNLHASLLPRWRGAAPIQRAIAAGDVQTGLAVMQMDKGLDTGLVIIEETLPITPDMTGGQLHDALAELGGPLLVAALAGLDGGDLTPVAQADAGASYAHKLTKADARIDWTRPAGELDCLIRAMNPFPGAWCEMDGKRLKILAARVVDGTGAPGTVLDDTLTIACGTGALALVTLQREGKGAMDVADFLRGVPVAAGTVLT